MGSMTGCGHSYPQRMVRQRVENFSTLKSARISRTAFKICFTVILLFLQIADKTNEENFFIIIECNKICPQMYVSTSPVSPGEGFTNTTFLACEVLK